ncbi:MAG: DUF1345 domain-containing protein [Candidatus Dormibacteria bacterium]
MTLPGDAPLPVVRHAFYRWEASIASLAAAVLFIPLPSLIRPGPAWLPTVVVGVMLIPLTFLQAAMHRSGGWDPPPRLVRMLALAVLGLIALGEALALARLLQQLPQISQGTLLFRSAVLIWAINILVFALSYWELDGGGPARRTATTCPPGDFLFPQQMNDKLNEGWSPRFLDYLFLAFNTATAFSPTDTMILSRPAKALMMIQAGISLLTVGLVVARGVNIIGPKSS